MGSPIFIKGEEQMCWYLRAEVWYAWRCWAWARRSSLKATEQLLYLGLKETWMKDAQKTPPTHFHTHTFSSFIIFIFFLGH